MRPETCRRLETTASVFHTISLTRIDRGKVENWQIFPFLTGTLTLATEAGRYESIPESTGLGVIEEEFNNVFNCPVYTVT